MNTVLAVVAYPRLDDVDRQWIESVRSTWDPQADRMTAHFMLAFPADDTPVTVDG